MSKCFQDRFFNIALGNDKPTHPLIKCQLPTCPLQNVHKDEVCGALHHTSNSSAPSPSEISYLLLKWAFKAQPSLFTLLFNHALSLSSHPWGNAIIIIILKSGKSDCTVAKTYCPISLLECCGKTLKKVVAARLSWEG
jgi:hypothetical protein